MSFYPESLGECLEDFKYESDVMGKIYILGRSVWQWYVVHGRKV